MEPDNLNAQLQPEFQQPQKPGKKKTLKIVIWVIVAVIFVIIIVWITAIKAYRYGKNNQRQNQEEISYPADSVFVDGWASAEDFAHWENAVFTIPQYDDIPVAFKRGIVKIFMDNNYLSSGNEDLYFFTKIKDRAYRVIAYGDFTGQGEREMAFLLEKTDFASSAIYIIPQKGNILYWKAFYNELPTIKSFKKGALIFMDEMKLVPAPSDGIIRQTKNSKHVLIYNHQTKTFDEYYQYTNEDIKNIQNIEEGDEGEEETAVDTASVGE